MSVETEAINRAVQIISPLLGAFLGFAGLKKLLTKWDVAETQFRNNGFSTREYHNTAIIEVVGSVGLFFPRTRFVGVVALLAMIAYLEIFSNRSASKSSPLYLRVPARITQVLLLGLAWVVRPRGFGG